MLTPATYGNPEAYGSLPAPDYSEAGVPSLDYVRDKIENRFGTAVGGAELAQAAADREAMAKAAAEAAGLRRRPTSNVGPASRPRRTSWTRSGDR